MSPGSKMALRRAQNADTVAGSSRGCRLTFKIQKSTRVRNPTRGLRLKRNQVKANKRREVENKTTLCHLKLSHRNIRQYSPAIRRFPAV